MSSPPPRLRRRDLLALAGVVALTPDRVGRPQAPARAEIATLDPEVREFDPRLALDGGADGLDCYRMLAAEASRWLKPGCWMLMEFGDGQAAALTELFAAHGWLVEGVEKDLSGRERVLMLRRPLE